MTEQRTDGRTLACHNLTDRLTVCPPHPPLPPPQLPNRAPKAEEKPATAPDKKKKK